MSFLVWRFPSSFWMPLRGVASHAAERAWNGRADITWLLCSAGCVLVVSRWWQSHTLQTFLDHHDHHDHHDYHDPCPKQNVHLCLCASSFVPGLLDSVSKTRSCRVTGKGPAEISPWSEGDGGTTWEMLTKRLSLRQFMLWVWPFRHDHLVLLLLHVSKMREIPQAVQYPSRIL